VVRSNPWAIYNMMAADFVLADWAELCGYLPEHVSLDQPKEVEPKSENEIPW